ncbi:uncharacterized protein [Miscanthus floridulus]|uniref:uncharacterized protein n=1 Tax=Miscanthus floridulus TaxID=154761 RepID=UPI003458A590
MADRSNCFRVVEESTLAAQGHKGFEPKMNEANGDPREVNRVCNDQDKANGESMGFREKLTMYFGDFLPGNMVDELCKLVQENSYGKCSFCLLPTESLILNVLQILLDAAQNANEVKEKNVVPQLSSKQQSQ